MTQRRVEGTSFPVNGKKNNILTTTASREVDGTWTAEIVHQVNGTTVKHRFITGFESLRQALRTAYEIAHSLADEKQSRGWVGYTAENSSDTEETEPAPDTNTPG